MSVRSATVAPDLTWTVTSDPSSATGCCTFRNRLLPTSKVVGFGGESFVDSACMFTVITGRRSLKSSRRRCISLWRQISHLAEEVPALAVDTAGGPGGGGGGWSHALLSISP